MAKQPVFCSQCGVPYAASTDWPKRCSSCGFEVWGNPIPVAIALCPMGDRVLLVQRNIMPGCGLWALPGGFVNHREIPEQAVSRELREETERWDRLTCVHPGLVIPAEAFSPCMTVGVPELNLILMFYRAVGVEHVVRRWFEDMDFASDDSMPWNAEVQVLKFATAEEVAKLSIAFPTHAEVLRRWCVEKRG